MKRELFLFLTFLGFLESTTDAFLPAHRTDAAINLSDRPAFALSSVVHRRALLTTRLYEENKDKGGGFFDFLNPFETNIPPELREEIFTAEGKTAAAQERNKRVALYAALTVLFIGIALFNGFLTELRKPLDPMEAMSISDYTEGLYKPQENEALTLEEMGFGWVQSNFLFRFFFMNKLGGGLALVAGGAIGSLAELELKGRQENAEKIWEELQRRREISQKKLKKKAPKIQTKSKKTKQSKRLAALGEVLAEDPPVPSDGPGTEAPREEQPTGTEDADKKEDGNGLFGKLKGFYQQADNMAASQALLLNKKLEDEGILEKVTDESGLKVIGKEEAAKLQQLKKETEVKD